MKWTTPLVLSVVLFRRARNRRNDTVRAGSAPRHPNGATPLVLSVVLSGENDDQHPAFSKPVFPEPALPAPQRVPSGGPGGPYAPLRGLGDPPVTVPAVSAARRALDGLALLAWRHAPRRLRNRPRFRRAVLTAAARSANS